MDRLWTPWRMAYVGSIGAPSGGCLFCDKAAQTQDAGGIEHRLLAPPRAAHDRERELLAEQAMGLDEDPEVLTRLERRDGQDVIAAEVGALTVSTEGTSDARRRNVHTRRLDAQRRQRAAGDGHAAVAP